MSISFWNRCVRFLSVCVFVAAFSIGPSFGEGSATYTYDTLGRVTSATYSNGTTITYSYDPAGNRTALVTSASGPVGTFIANPGVIPQGGGSVLTWSSSNATSVTIDNGVGPVSPVSGGAVNVTPSTTTTYSLTLTGPGGSIIRQATVTVTPPPTGTFAANPTSIAQGGSVALNWTSSGATSASIDNGVGAVSPVSGGSVNVGPSVTTTYTLTLTGFGGTTTKQVTVTVNSAPNGTFAANPASISQGASAALSWSSTGATSASIDNGIGVVSPVSGGSVNVSPSATTTYTLTLTGPGGTTTRQATVTVHSAPTGTFAANPTSIAQGASATLTWTSGDATGASIDNGVGPVTPVSGGSVGVTPSVTTTYTLTLIGAGGTTTRQATVTVYPPPAGAFSANPTSIAQGASATLSWTISGATSASIDNGIGAVSPTVGSANVSPSVTTTYTLTLTGAGGTTTKQATVTVIPPPTGSFSANPIGIPAGGTSALSWTSSGASSASIDNGVGAVTPASGGSVNVSPSTTTTYTLTLTGAGGTTTKQATVTVSPPPTGSFSANPSTVTQGNSSTLSWSSAGATSASINNGIGSVTPVAGGSVTVTPSSTTTYVLTLTGPGGTVTRSATVTVNSGGPPSGTFQAQPDIINNGQSSTLSWTSQNATSASINHAIGNVSVPNGAIAVSPHLTITYTLTLTGPQGTTTLNATVEVIH